MYIYIHMYIYICIYIGVSTNGGTPKWLVYKREIPLKLMIWGYPYFRKPTYIYICMDIMTIFILEYPLLEVNILL